MMNKSRLYIQFAAKFAIRNGTILFVATSLIAGMKILLMGSDDPTSTVLTRLDIAGFIAFSIFYVGCFVYGLFKYHIEAPFSKSLSDSDAS